MRFAARASAAICRGRRSSCIRGFDVAAQLGVSVQGISQTIRIATLGDLPQNGAKFSLDRSADSDPREPARERAPRSGPRSRICRCRPPGGAVPLKTVADLSFGQGPSAVRRYNQSRRVFLEADLSPGVQFGTATKKIYALPTLHASARRACTSCRKATASISAR